MRGEGSASVPLDRAKGERRFGSCPQEQKQKSGNLHGSGRGESWNYLQGHREPGTWNGRALRMLAPWAPAHSRCVFVHPAPISGGPDVCRQANFTRYQECRD